MSPGNRLSYKDKKNLNIFAPFVRKKLYKNCENIFRSNFEKNSEKISGKNGGKKMQKLLKNSGKIGGKIWKKIGLLKYL